jgi:hypothetical protein
MVTDSYQLLLLNSPPSTATGSKVDQDRQRASYRRRNDPRGIERLSTLSVTVLDQCRQEDGWFQLSSVRLLLIDMP